VNLPQLCIRRPVFTISMCLILVIVGIIGFLRLSVREYPNITKPVVSVRTYFTGASAALMENQITTPIENAIATVSGVDAIRSTSMDGASRITVEFADGYDLNVGMNDLRDKIFAILRKLPQGVDAPVLSKSDSDSNPTVIIALTDPNENVLQLSDYVNRYVLPAIQQTDGVSDVRMFGSLKYAMRVELDPDKMAAQNVTVDDLINILNVQNVNVPAGSLMGQDRDYPVVANAQLRDPQAFSHLIVRNTNGVLTRFSDVANITVGAEDPNLAFRVHGVPGVALGIIPDSTANIVTVSDNIKQLIVKLRTTLPPQMKIFTVYDRSDFVKESINEVYKAIFLAVILVVIIVFLFLGSIRSTFIPIVTIPLCLISIFAVLYFFNYSINTITLLALVLAIGLVVDDAIVMLENIHRHIEEGMPPFDAALLGSKEIIFAIIAMTITLAAVYLPITFTNGLTGTLFSQFAVTLAGTVLLSGFIALTLSPMMSARLLKPMNSTKGYSKWLDTQLHRLMLGYKATLEQVLNHRTLILVSLLVIGVLGWRLFATISTELMPTEDRAAIIASIDAPTNSSFAYTNNYAQQIEKIYSTIPEIKNYFMSIGGNQGASGGYSMVTLTPWATRHRSQQQIMQELSQKVKNITGVDVYLGNPSALTRGFSSNNAIDIRISSSADYQTLYALSHSIVKDLQDYPGMINLDTNLEMDNQEFNVAINRVLAADLQVNVQDINNAIATFLGGQVVGYYEFDSQDYDVWLQLKRDDLTDLSGINKIYVRSNAQKMIPLASLVTITPIVGPVSLPHYNRLRADEITGDLAPGYSLGDVLNYLQEFLPNHLPSNASFVFTGSSLDFLQAHNRMNMIFLLAIIFIYLVLAAQFESFSDPFIVLFSVPLSIVGALLVLRLTNGSLNIFSQIGLVTLVGLIAKHGILITEFANQLQAKGMAVREAVVEAAARRLRPILMTTGAMVLGALPLALATGPGAASRQQIGWVIVGGMLIGTFFSLFVVPSAYITFARKKLSPCPLP
jgi:multidrug efflux pump